METRVRFIVVGAFALAAFVGVFLFVYWMHASGGLSQTRLVRVEFEGAASGLRAGSAVTFNGVRIGEVTRIAFNAARANVVDADLAVEASAPLRVDAKVGVEAQGLLGTTVVALYGVSVEAPLLPSSTVLRASASAPLMEQARVALADVQSVVAENRDSLKSAMRNIDIFATALARNSGKIDNIVSGLEQLTGHGPKPSPPQFLDLQAPHDFPALAAPAGQIAVAEVSAPTGFQTQKIISRSGPESPLTLGEAQWTDTTPKLIQLKLVEAFENAGLGGSVARTMDNGQPDLQLQVDLRRFEIDLAKSQAVVELSARLTGKDGRIVAAKLFHATAPGSAGDGAAAASALSAAFGEVAKELVAWTAETAK